MKSPTTVFVTNERPERNGIFPASRAWRSAQAFAANSLLLLLVFLAGAVRAQNGVGDIVYTVGTTARDTHGRDWAYLLWQGVEPSLVSNRLFAIYAKPGEATNPVPYARLSLVAVQTDPRVIEPLLERAANVGDDLVKLDQDIEQLFGSFIPSSSVTRAEQLSAVIRGSLGNAVYYQNLLLLARNHPGVDMALGLADAELMPTNSPVWTYEVRVFDPVTSQDLAVIGRVTIEAGNPTVLPAPGPPVLVPVNSPMGDLNLKFRWGTPDNLRRLGLMQFGFNLYRVEKNYAGAHGWNAATPPPDAALLALIATNPAAAKRVNVVPVTPAVQFTLTEAANLTPPTGDTNTSFIMDDDGRGRPGYTNYNWINGAQFYYYVAARDVLGRDGQLSSGLLATVCDRMPPLPPTDVHVVNDYQYDPLTAVSNQALRVTWKQNLHTNDTIVNYWIYRWTNLMEMNAYSGDPNNNLIGIVAHLPGATNNSFLDNGAGSPSALGAYGKTFWYTVRAGDAGACGQNLSQPAGPAYGVLRQRVGPAAGTGYIEINCLRPVVNFVGTRYVKEAADPTNFDFQLNCARLDSRFDWAEFYGIGTYTVAGAGPPIVITVSNYFGRLYYLGNSTVTAWWTPPQDPSGQGYQYTSISFQVWCRAALNNGKTSTFNIQNVTAPGLGTYAAVDFQAVAQSIRTVAGVRGQEQGCTEHDPGGGGGGVFGTNNICVHVQPSARSQEYRIYRRVDDGPLTLLAAGAVSNSPDIEACDNNTPVNGGTMCFYVQFLDENGNPSPLTWIGCVDTAPVEKLPTPVLAKITPIGTDPTNAQMSLAWFCPPYGVDRFELYIAGKPTPPDTNYNALSPQLLSTGAPPTPVVFTINGTNLNASFFSFLTPKVGPQFGNGAQFSVPCAIEPGKQYYVAVRALSRHGDPGDWSNFQPFIWTPSNPPALQVPWPARPLPSTNANFLALAFYLSPTNAAAAFKISTATPSGIGVLIGSGNIGREVNVNVKEIFGRVNPNALLETNGLGDVIFPCALYRYQTPNANFPTVSGDVIQVSPLMENIAYQWSGVAGQGTNTFVLDPFVALSASYPYAFLWLRDTQPQISGARYKYLLVRFDPVTHEIDQLIPSNEVDVP